MNDTHPGRAAALFLQLVQGLQQSGMMSLGKLMNPISRKIDVHLDIARDTIDTLAAIEARTRGNLEPDEARVLRQVLTDLRMNYLDAVKKAGAAGVGAGAGGGGANESDGSTLPSDAGTAEGDIATGEDSPPAGADDREKPGASGATQ
ncbi:MAG: DUF1844 domain-containing protein [Candidatus Eisenbacteria bacterium]